MLRYAFALLALLPVTVLHAELPKLELKAETLDAPKAISDEMRKVLARDAFTINAGGEKLLTIWFREAIPSSASEEQIQNGLTYREITEGTLIGVVQFAQPFTDFRKQEIPAGVYTLRLAVQPDIGDHKDTAPHQDFALVVPAKLDRSPDSIEVKDLVGLSRKAPGGDHPGVMLFFPYYGKEAAAKLVPKEKNVMCLQLRRDLATQNKKATLGFALVVSGSSDKR